MDEEVSITTMRRCVRNAGVEDALTADQLKEVYNTLKNSVHEKSMINTSLPEDDDNFVKDLENMEDEPTTSQPKSTRRGEVKSKMTQSTGSPGSPILNRDSLCSDDDSPVKMNKVHSNKSIIYDWKVAIHFNDMPVSDTKNTLPIIHHKLEYMNIQNSPQFLAANVKDKAKMLIKYHMDIAKLKTEYARKFGTKVPLPKPIIATGITVSSSLHSFQEEDSDKETYISRSGRMTKRKVYCYEDDTVESAISSKKSKSSANEEWLSKSPFSKTSKSRKSESLKESNGVDIETENITKPDIKEKPGLRLGLSKKASNDEIMARSSLFKDTTNGPKSRSDVISDNLKKAEEEKRKSEKSMDLFSKTLVQLDEDALLSETVDVDDDFEEKQIYRRVVPLLPARRPIGSRKKKDAFTPLPIKTLPSPSTASAEVPPASTSTISSSQDSDQSASSKPINTRRRITRTSKVGPENAAVASTSGSHDNNNKSSKDDATVLCPICNSQFPINKIEEHAATCGEGDVIPQSTNKKSSITCHVCDKVVPFHEEYEIHVDNCLQKKSQEKS